MSTTDPAGEGGGGGQSATTVPTNADHDVTPTTPITSSSVPPGSQQQHPPPSPLSGCYLLVVLPEPHIAQHKDLILNRLAKALEITSQQHIQDLSSDSSWVVAIVTMIEGTRGR
ncbi:hypothetical protein KPH14_002714 [Odynerus spinipes]|nr:hypothetical protein KPH14_002714 [Odynerus spinipes]